jgi:hypothetical protein
VIRKVLLQVSILLILTGLGFGVHFAGAQVLARTAQAVTTSVDPIETPGVTNSVELVSSYESNGYKVEFFRNTSYPCSISGYQTFAVLTRLGISNSKTRPLWLYLHPGGIGWFGKNGYAVPDEAYLKEESVDRLVFPYGLNERVLDDRRGFRMMFASYCNRDLYGGAVATDPYNPNRLPDGKRRGTNGLWATKAAVQFTLNQYATSKYFLAGGSAGSAGAYMLAWSLQRQGLTPAGIVADSYVVNQRYVREIERQRIVCPNTGVPMTAATVEAFSARLHPTFALVGNEPDRLVVSGRLRVPILQVWSQQDPFGCDGRTLQCPLRDGSTKPLGGMDCMNEPLRRVIAAQGASSKSLSMRLCVASSTSAFLPCGKHVVTEFDGVNTNPAWPADYNGRIMQWVRARLAD